MSRLSRLVKLAALTAALGGGWHLYQQYLESGAALERGRQAMRRGNYEAAIDSLEIAHGRDPSDLTICIDLADCCVRTGQERDALYWYRRAEPLLAADSGSISLMRHKDKFAYLSQRNDWNNPARTRRR